MQITVQGSPLSVLATGPSDAPPVLFIHGFPLSNDLWLEASEALSDRFRCLLPDLRGHGNSLATGENYTIGRYADDLAELLAQLAPGKPATVVGLSMGGTIALEFFRAHGAHVRALGLVCCRSEAETPEGATARRALIENVRTKGSIAAADAMVDKVLGPGASPSLRDRWHTIMRSTPPEGVIAAASALLHRPNATPLLGTINVPTLVVAGDRDQITPLDGMLAMHRAIKGSAFACVPNSGHLAPVEQPEIFAAILRKFMVGLA